MKSDSESREVSSLPTNESSRILAIDIGGSKLLTALVNVEEGKGRQASLSAVSRRPLFRDSGKEGVLAALEEAVSETLRQGKTDLSDVKGLGVTIPGLADPQRGHWIYAPFSGIGDFPIAEILCEKYRKPVFAENDVNACAWGERIFGVCQNVDDFLWVTVSNGIGGGLVLGGKIYAGTFGCAGEIGHFNVVKDGALCGCGHRGCLEAEAAGPAIARRFAAMIDENRVESQLLIEFKAKSRIPDEKSLSAAEIALWAREGGETARLVFDITGNLIGHALGLAANLINPARIVIGGGVAGAFDLMEPSMKMAFNAEAMTSANRNVSIVKTGLGYEAGLFGAASLLWQEEDKTNF